MFSYSQRERRTYQPTLERHRHRLISLDMILQESVKRGQMAHSDYLTRSKFVRRQINRLDQIAAVEQSDQNSRNQQLVLGLPNIDDCTPEERRVCFNFLLGRQKLLEKLHGEASKILMWAQKASEGDGFRWFNIFRLSKLKKRLSRVEYWNSQLEYDDKNVNEHIAKLCGMMSSRSSKKLETNLHGLIALFNELDTISARVSKVRTQIKNDEQSIVRMQQYLGGMRNGTPQHIAFQMPPSVFEAEHAAKQATAININPLAGAQERLQLARNYIERCLEKTTKPEAAWTAAATLTTKKMDFSHVSERPALTQPLGVTVAMSAGESTKHRKKRRKKRRK